MPTHYCIEPQSSPFLQEERRGQNSHRAERLEDYGSRESRPCCPAALPRGLGLSRCRVSAKAARSLDSWAIAWAQGIPHFTAWRPASSRGQQTSVCFP